MRRSIAAVVVLAIGVPLWSFPASAAVQNAGTALQFNGSSQYVTFGAAPGLGASQFTIELWFKRTGAGVGTGTGTGGITSAIPLITKGRAEAEGSNVDMNYFFGIDATSGKLVADFEEGAGGTGPLGLNHPVSGNAVVTSNVWHHAAVTYDGTWRIFLDGQLDATLAVNQPPRADSIQHAALGTAMTSTGAASGFFQGVIDEARIWNVARTQAQIQSTKNTEISSPQTGLLGRWGLNEGSGSTAGNTFGTAAVNGSLVAGPTWVPGFVLPGNYALQLNGSSQYVTFGTATGLGAAQFTLELWFKKTGTGVATSTGTGGVNAIPLLTKGRAESEGSNVDMNYFFGIDATSDKLVADFEEGAAGTSPGLNHPISGGTVITSNVWHHAAVTYDGTWKIYLDGQPETLTGTAVVNQPPRSDSIQHAALGTAMTSTGVQAGFLQGVIDEARIWNVARTSAQIQATRNAEISSSQANLLGHWNLNEGDGTVVNNTFGSASVSGTTSVSPAPSWVDGFVVDTTPPAAPQNLTSSVVANGIGLSWNASSEPDVAGYNVYRGTGPGVSARGSPLNGALLTTPSYTDTTVTPGTAYYYVVTAVDTANNASQPSNEVTRTFPAGNYALDLNGSSQYVSMGPATALDASQFTIELWFKRMGTGVATSTGTGGWEGTTARPLAIPLLTKGRAEAETPANVNMNYFLGIDVTNGVLVGDFEDAAGGANHPVGGATSITPNVWHHAAATFDGTTFRLYLDGRLDGSVSTTAVPESTSIQHFALGTAMNSTGVAAGFFAGQIDEARAWSVARSQAQIQADKNTEIGSNQTGLLGHWAMNDGLGTSVRNTFGTPGADGATTGGPNWVTGFVAPPQNDPPTVTLGAPADGATNTSSSPTLNATVADPEHGPITVKFYGRPYKSGTFTLIATNSNVTDGQTSTTWSALGDGQTFEWKVVADDGANTTEAAVSRFSTAAGPDPVIVGAGDIAACDSQGDEATADVLDGVQGIVFTAGDDAYDSGTDAEFANCYDPTWGRAKARTLLPVPGNHEYGTPNAQGYFNYFGSAAGPVGKGYYSYDVNSKWHVITLNSECAQVGGCTAGSVQETWFKSDLAANASKNVIVIWHKPRWSSGATNLTELQAFWSDAYDYGVDLVMVGHDHIYERFAPMDKNGAVDNANGVRQITIGTGGEGHHGLVAVKPASIIQDDETFGILKLTLHASSYDWQFLPVAGGTFTDSGTATVNGGANTAPTITSVNVTPTSPGTSATVQADVIATDADNDSLTYSYQWIKDGQDIVGETDRTLDLSQPGNGDRGAVIAVRVTANDGLLTSAPATSSGVTIGNTPPTATVSLAPNPAGTNDVVTATAAPSDADGDPVTLTYVWKVDGTTVRTTPSTSSLTDTLDLSQAGNGDGGQTIRVDVTPSDGTPGQTASSQMTVGSAKPVVNSVSIDETAPTTDTTLHVTTQATDADNDPITFTYRWFKNGSVLTGETSSTLNLGTAGNGDNGDAITVEVTAHDPQLASDPMTSSPVTIGNTAPTATVSLAPASPGSDAVLTATATRADADGDTVLLTYVWKVNGTVVKSTAATSNLTDTLDLSQSGNGDRGDQITVDVTPNDGHVDGQVKTATVSIESKGLSLNGSSQHVTFGSATGLDAAQFTLEIWFKRTAAGVGTSTGTGGVANAIPLVTKGRAEAETPANVNMNYFLGIDAASGVLVADFEDAAGGGNHPITGTTAVSSNVWHHAAASYDGTTWRLYLDGQLDASSQANATPEATSIQHAALGTAMTSTGTAAGFFAGVIDEARIWDHARTGAQIRSARNTEITAAQSGLLGRWGFEKGSGTVAANSAGGIDGSIVGNASWVTGYQFPQDSTAPTAPTGFTATAGDGVVSLQWSANGEADLAGYNLFRSTSTPVDTSGTPLNGGSLLTGTTYTDASVTDGTQYHYVLVAVDTSNNASARSAERTATPQAPPPAGLQLDGSTRHVTFGRALGLDSAQFTLELWIKRTGAGTGTSTGTGGIASAIPLLAKGRAEAETPANVNMNYFLGIDASTGVLVADFEDAATGANHPVTGQTEVTSNVWHHVAATYDGTSWRLYLDGRPDGSLAVNATPEATSIQHAALGTAMNSTGVADGHFAGIIDEARVWNYARTGSQITAAKDTEVTGPQTGLLGRWGMNEGSGTTIADSSGHGITGTITDALGWTDGFVPPPPPPNDPVLNSPNDGAQNTIGSPTLDVTVSDPDAKPLTVTFWGRPFASGQYEQLATSTNVASAGQASTVWTNPGDGQTFQWYVTVDNGSGVARGPVWTFSTANGVDPVFVGAGDVAKCDSSGDEATGAIIAKVNGTVFTTGDNVYVNGTAAEFATCYDPSWGPVKGRTRPAPGNHDWNTGNLDGYFGYYGMANASDANGKSYYSYDIDSRWHVIVLDTECANVGGCGAGSPQETWLRSDLSAHLDDNIIVIWHKPRFSSGSTNLTELQTFFQDIYDAGADLLLVGHDHVYERFDPLNPQGQVDTAAGVRVFTIGTGGAEHHTFSTVRTGSVVRNSDTWGVMKFTLHANSYHWTFLPENGKTFTDSGTAPVNASQNSPPTAAAQSVSVVEDTPKVITLQGSDTDGDTLTFAKAGAPAHGTLAAISASTCGVTPNVCTATVTYTPDANYNGADGFTFTASDPLHTSTAATVSITVAPVNDAPVGVPDSYDADQHTPLQIAAPGVLANDSDAEGSALTAVSPTQPAHGTVTLNANGSFTYTPVATYTGTDSFTYAARDGSLQSAPTTVTLTVHPDTTAPETPAGLVARTTTTSVVLDWTNNDESDLAGYDVSRSTSPAGPFTKLNTNVIPSSDYRDDTAAPAATSYYRVAAVDVAGNASTASTVGVTRTISLRSTGSAANKGATSLSIAAPNGIRTGDVLLATIDVLGAPSNIAAPAGWTQVTNTASGSSLRHATYVKVAGATEPSSYLWTWSTRQGASGGIAAYVGVDTTTPIDTSAAQSNASSTSIVAPSLTLTTSGDVLVAAFGIATNPTFVPATGMDERIEVAGGSTKVGSSLDDQIFLASGTTGTRTALASKAGANVGSAIALRPAGSSSGDTQVPSTPTNLRRTSVTATQVQLAWDASTDDVGVDHYVIFRNGTAIGTSGTTSYTDSTVAESTTYQYTVTAVDAAGNASSASGAVSVTTPAVSGITFRSASESSANATAVTLPTPAGAQIGDVLLAALDVRGTPNITAPAGWTLVGIDTVGSTTTHATYSHSVASAEPASYTWNLSARSASVGIVLAYAGVDTAAPIANSDSIVTSTNTRSLTAPSLTASSGQVLVAFFGTTVNASITPPTGLAERAEIGSSGGKVHVEGSDRQIATDGNTGILMATASKATGGVGRSILLKPAP